MIFRFHDYAAAMVVEGEGQNLKTEQMDLDSGQIVQCAYRFQGS
jgi:hypothetical protein